MMLMNHFPADLITDIFSRLPAKTLACLKVVCKSWNNLISDDYFVNRHLERNLATKTNLHYVVTTPRDHVLYSADFDSLDNPLELSHPFKNCTTGVGVLGSCRGLVLLRVGSGHLLLYNPTTQSYNVLPLLPDNNVSFWSDTHIDYGLGYDSVSNNYKCVRIRQTFGYGPGIFLSEVFVYSLKTNCWKGVPKVPWYFKSYNRAIGVLVHEMFHWIGTNSDNVVELIVAFNLRDESFSCLPLPNFQFEQSDGVYVGMLDGCLCLLANCYLRCIVWVMKEYGVAGSWTRMFTFRKFQCFNLERPISYSMDKKRLLVILTLGNLVSLDLETTETPEVTNDDFVTFADWDRGLDAHVYAENLLMLRDYAEFADDIRIRINK